MRKAIRRAWQRAKACSARAWASRLGRAGAILVAVLGVGYVLLWWLPKWQVAHLAGSVSPGELFRRENEARQTWAGIIGGLVVLGTLYFTWRRVAATERQVEVAREGQITERFTRAIEQLGQRERLEVRLGGIYALERIARDSEKDHWPIMEVLTAYVRRSRAWSAERPEPAPPLPIDIQAILTVLGRRAAERRRVEEREGLFLDLSGVDLRGADLGGAHLERARLRAVHLEGADLEGVQLGGASLLRARLREADLGDAGLEGATLAVADLREASLLGARLVRASLVKADLRGAMLGGADLAGAGLWGSRLGGADFPDACLRGTRLQRVDLRGAEGLTYEQIAEAITDETTVLPDYLKDEGTGE